MVTLWQLIVGNYEQLMLAQSQEMFPLRSQIFSIASLQLMKHGSGQLCIILKIEINQLYEDYVFQQSWIIQNEN